MQIEAEVYTCPVMSEAMQARGCRSMDVIWEIMRTKPELDRITVDDLKAYWEKERLNHLPPGVKAR